MDLTPDLIYSFGLVFLMGSSLISLILFLILALKTKKLRKQMELEYGKRNH